MARLAGQGGGSAVAGLTLFAGSYPGGECRSVTLWEQTSVLRQKLHGVWRRFEGLLFLTFLKLVCTLWVLVYPVLATLQVDPFTKKIGLWIALFALAFGVSQGHRFQDKFSQWRAAFRERDRLLLGFLSALCYHVEARREGREPDQRILELQRIALQLLVRTARTLTAAPAGVDLSANVMVVEGNELVLTTFDSMLLGRKYIRLPFDSPGAGQAYRDQEPVYVHDITAPEYSDRFDQSRPYRSIISFPIMLGDRCTAVVNIDSTEPDFFDFRNIRDPLYPIVMLVGLTIEIP